MKDRHFVLVGCFVCVWLVSIRKKDNKLHTVEYMNLALKNLAFSYRTVFITVQYKVTDRYRYIRYH